MKKIVNKINVAVIAVLLGVGLIAVQSAFKASSTKRLRSTFYYDGSNYQTANVTNPANWKYDEDGNLCSAVQERACTIQVDTSFVNSGTNTLKSTINLTANTSAPNVAYVTGSADSGMGIFNEENP